MPKGIYIRAEETKRKISEAHKGKTPWNKGKKGIYQLSEETKRKISAKMKIAMEGKHTSPRTEFKKGHEVSKEIRKKISQTQIGKKISAETRRKLSEAFSGSNHPLWGKHHPEETIKKIRNTKIKLYENNPWLKTEISNSVKRLWQNSEYRQTHIGPNHHWWKGGLTKREETLAHALRVELRNWAKEVLERDNYICQMCGRKFRKNFLHAHHIKALSGYPSLALDVLNGLTLCKNCHFGTKSYGKKLEKQSIEL